MRKVAHIGKYYHPCRGGLESSLQVLVNSLANFFEIKVLVSNTVFKTEIEKQGNVEIIRLASLGRFFSQPLTLSLFGRMKHLDVDIIHLHLPNPLAMLAYLMSRSKAALVVSYHSDIVRQRLLGWFLVPLLNLLLEKACKIVVTSSDLMEHSRVLQKFRYKCAVIPHGIDVKVFTETRDIEDELRQARSLVKNPIVLFVGRLVYYKGLEYLIKAMEKINAQLVIVGNGPLRNRLARYIRKRGMQNKIFMAGEVPEKKLRAYYKLCDVFVLPSTENSETFGVVILEAQAAAKPVVSTMLPTGLRQTNLDQVTGIAVPPKDSAALASAINSLLNSKELRSRYGENGRLRVCGEFSKEIMVKKYLTLYNTITKEN